MKKVLKNINTVFYATLAVATLFAFTGFFFLSKENMLDPQSQAAINISSIYFIFILAVIPGSLYLFNKQSRKWALLSYESKKLMKYERGAIIRIAIIQTALIAGLVIFYFLIRTESILFCIGIVVVSLFFCKPNESKIETDLQINQHDDVTVDSTDDN